MTGYRTDNILLNPSTVQIPGRKICRNVPLIVPTGLENSHIGRHADKFKAWAVQGGPGRTLVSLHLVFNEHQVGVQESLFQRWNVHLWA